MHSSLWRPIDNFLPESIRKIINQQTFDLDGSKLPDECIRALYECGYFRMVIPTQFGGQGANLAQACSVQRTLGYLFPSLGVATAMHLFTVGMIVEHWYRKRDLSWMLLQAISDNNALVASAFAEPGLGGCLVRSNTKAVKVSQGYLLSGVKIPCSLLSRSRFVCLHAQTLDDRLIVGLLPSHSSGFQVKNGPKFMGMTASESDILVLESCLLPNQLVMHETQLGVDHSDIFKASLIWFCTTASSVYLGLTLRALESAKEKLNKLTIPTSKGRQICRADLGYLQARFGEIYSQFLNLETSLAGFAEILAQSQSVNVNFLPQALAIKQTAARELPKLISALSELCGGSTYLIGDPINQALRDIQAIHFHPPTPLWVDRILGQVALKDHLNFDFILDLPE